MYWRLTDDGAAARRARGPRDAAAGAAEQQLYFYAYKNETALLLTVLQKPTLSSPREAQDLPSRSSAELRAIMKSHAPSPCS